MVLEVDVRSRTTLQSSRSVGLDRVRRSRPHPITWFEHMLTYDVELLSGVELSDPRGIPVHYGAMIVRGSSASPTISVVGFRLVIP